MFYEKIKSQILAILFLDFLPFSSLHAAEIGLGLGYPYVSLKYNFSKPYGAEIRYARGKGINVYAGRFYWNYYSDKKLRGFSGLEYGHITFDTLDIKGTGYEASVFIGGEYSYQGVSLV